MIEIANSFTDTKHTQLTDDLIQNIISRYENGAPCEYYENLNSGVFLYADFDMKHDENKTKAEHLKIINEQIVLFCLSFQIDRKLAKIKIANSKKKTSFHIISKEKRFNDPREIKELIEDYELKFDKSVYSGPGKRQLFRLLYTTKKGENRPFVPVDSMTLKPIKVSLQEYKDYIINAGPIEAPEEEAPEEEAPEGEAPDTPPDTPEEAKEQPEEEEDEEDDDLINQILKILKDKKPEIAGNNGFKKSEIQGTNKLIIYFKRLKASFCALCNREHTRDGTDFLIYHYDTKAIYLGCTKENKTFERLDDNKIEEAERATNQQKLMTILKEAEKKEYVEALIEADKKEFRDAGIEPQIIDTATFLSENETIKNEVLQGESDIIAIKAPKGTGKTELFILLLTLMNQTAKTDKERHDPNLSILLISSRISLAKKFVEDLEALGLEVYYDIKTQTIGFKHYKLAIQLDSIHRSQREKYDIIIIDEAHQLLAHLYAESFLKQDNLDRNLWKFKSIIQRSKKIMLLDANLKVEDIEYIKEIRNAPRMVKCAFDREAKDAIISLYYGVKAENLRSCKITNDEPTVIKMIIERIKEGKKVAIFGNYSAKRLSALASLLKMYMNDPERLLLITSKTITSERVVNALKSVNTEFLNYDVIICSPSVQSGISFYVPNVIYQIFGLFCNLSANAIASTQMLGRVRNPINPEVIVSIQMSNSYIVYKNPSEYFDYIRVNRKHFEKDLIRKAGLGNVKYNKYGHIELIANEFINEIVNFKITQSGEKKAFVRDFINLQVVEGIKCEYLETDITTEETKQIKREFKDAKVRNDEIRAKELADAPNITQEEMKDINRKQRHNLAEVNYEELTAKEKKIIKTIYGAPDELENEPLFFFIYNNDNIKEVFRNRRIYCGGFETGLQKFKDIEIKKEINQNRLRETETHIYERETNEAMVRSMLFNSKFQKHRILLSLLSLLGFNSFNSDNLAQKKDIIAGFKSFLLAENNHKELVQILGKHQQKEKTLKTHSTNPKFLKIMLDFFNPSLTAEFGIKIKKTGNDYEMIDIYNEHFRTLEDEPPYYKGAYLPLITPYKEI